MGSSLPRVKKDNMAAASQPSQSIADIPIVLGTKQSKGWEEAVVQEEYESPSDHESPSGHESSESSSGAYPSNAKTSHDSEAREEVAVAAENIDVPDNSKSMYEKSSNSSNSTESESGTSSCDSDSQSSNSDHQLSRTVINEDKLR